jgi:hypothetical protein
MKTELNVLFKSMQRDDKKEVLKFQIHGNEMKHAQSLVEMAGGIVILELDGCEAGETTAEFATLQRDSKKTVLKFNVKGDSEEKAVKLYRFAGTNVTLRLQPSQMSIEEFYGNDDDREGIEYTVNKDGTVDVDTNQLSLDDVAAEQEEDKLPDEGSEKVADLEQERKRRGRPKKNAYAYPTPDESTSVAETDEDALPTPDDGLPF